MLTVGNPEASLKAPFFHKTELLIELARKDVAPRTSHGDSESLR